MASCATDDFFQYYRSSAWAGGYGGYRASRFADLSRRRRDRRNGDQLSLYAAAFSAHEYDGLTARAYGAKDPLRLARALVQPLILAFGAGALIVLLRTPLIDFALHIVGGSDAVLEQARRFLEIRWLSAPASLANPVLLGWLLGVQYARAPVILLVVGNLLNIMLDLWLVMGLHMNVRGAALATAIAEYGTLLIGLGMVWRVLAMRGITRIC